LKLHIVLEAAFCGFLSLWGRFGKATIIGRVSEERLLTGVLLKNDALPAVHAMVVSRQHTVVIFALENVPFERGVSL